jgi:hypothetical protein
MRIACKVPKATKHTHTHTHYLSTATMVARTRLIVTLYVQCPSFFHLLCESVDDSSELIRRRNPARVHTLLRNAYRKENDGFKSLYCIRTRQANLALWRLCVTIVSVNNAKNIECITTITLRRIYAAGNNKTLLGLHVECQCWCPIATELELLTYLYKSA